MSPPAPPTMTAEELALEALGWVTSKVGVAMVEGIIEAVTGGPFAIIDDLTVAAAAIVRMAIEQTDEGRVRAALEAYRAVDDLAVDKLEDAKFGKEPVTGR
jgi:hypothetical protein